MAVLPLPKQGGRPKLRNLRPAWVEQSARPELSGTMGLQQVLPRPPYQDFPSMPHPPLSECPA